MTRVKEVEVDRPTEEQIREFWEWCGFKFYPRGSHDKFHRLDAFLYPDGTWHTVTPLIDLNNLFMYAVPKFKFEYGSDALLELLYDWASSIATSDWNDELPALTLFWALWEVKEGK